MQRSPRSLRYTWLGALITSLLLAFMLVTAFQVHVASAETPTPKPTEEPTEKPTEEPTKPPQTGNGSSITIVKKTRPQDDSVTFDFSGDLGDFSLQGYDSTNQTDDSKTFSNLMPIQEYTISETNLPDGWRLVGISCSADESMVDLDLRTATVTIDLAKDDEVTCTFTNENQRRGSIVVTKYEDLNADGDRDNDEPVLEGWQMFLFENGTLLEGPQSTGADGTTSFDNLADGSYTVCEQLQEGWTNTDPGTECEEVEVSNGATVPAQFGNAQRGTITIVKQATPTDAEATFDFTFNVVNDFTLDGSNDGTNNVQVYENLQLNVPFDVTETGLPDGWELTDITCDSDGADFETQVEQGRVEITLEESGASITCTFINQRRGSLTVVKDVIPDNPNIVFLFLSSGDFGDTSFGLIDDGSQTANSETFEDLLPGTQSITETGIFGLGGGEWVLADITCVNSEGQPADTENLDLEAGGVTVNLRAGEDVTCTFTNEEVTGGSVVVTKYEDVNLNGERDNDEPGLEGWNIALVQDQEIVAGPQLTGADGTTTFDDVDDGTYLVCEQLQDGWTPTDPLGTTCKEVEVSDGGTVAVALGNAQRGTITIVKQATPTDAQASFVFDFSDIFDFTLDGSNDGTNNVEVSNGVPLNTPFDVTETNLPDGWELTAITCDSDGADFETNVEQNRVQITLLKSGASITCTFTNEQPSDGSIVVTKYEDLNADGDRDAGEPVLEGWGMRLLQGGNLIATQTTGADGTTSFDNLDDGSYTVCEILQPGWMTTDPGTSCQQVEVSNGGTVPVAFGNAQLGTITIVKQAIPTDAQANFAFDLGDIFDFTLDGSNDGTNNVEVFDTVGPNRPLDVTETDLPDGWELTAITCESDGADFETNVEQSQVEITLLKSDASITCTFTNEQQSGEPQADLEIEKSAEVVYEEIGSCPTFDVGAEDPVIIEVGDDGNGRPEGEYSVQLLSAVDNDDGTSTWTYNVTEVAGKDLSHWTLALPQCVSVVSHTEPGGGVIESVEEGFDPTTQVDGIKWNVTDEFSSGQFSVTINHSGCDCIQPGDTTVAAKTGGQGDQSNKANITGPTNTSGEVTRVPIKVIYTINVTNNGPDSADNVTVTDEIPAGLQVNEATLPSACSLAGNTVTCGDNLELTNGQSATFTIETDVTNQEMTSVTNTATVTSDVTDPQPNNNSDTIETSLVPSALSTLISALFEQEVRLNSATVNYYGDDGTQVYAEETGRTSLKDEPVAVGRSGNATDADEVLYGVRVWAENADGEAVEQVDGRLFLTIETDASNPVLMALDSESGTWDEVPTIASEGTVTAAISAMTEYALVEGSTSEPTQSTHTVFLPVIQR